MLDTYYALVYLLITQVYFLYYSLVIQSWHNSTDQIKLVAVIGLYSETTLQVIHRRHEYLANLPSDGSLQPRCHYAINLFTIPCHYFYLFIYFIFLFIHLTNSLPLIRKPLRWPGLALEAFIIP